jgi:hypothetical protein
LCDDPMNQTAKEVVSKRFSQLCSSGIDAIPWKAVSKASCWK